MNNPDLPLPNDTFDGGIVIASCWGNDEPQDDGTPPFATLLVLDPKPPFYRLFQIEVTDAGGWRKGDDERSHPNIIPAAEDYSDSIGGY